MWCKQIVQIGNEGEKVAHGSPAACIICNLLVFLFSVAWFEKKVAKRDEERVIPQSCILLRQPWWCGWWWWTEQENQEEHQSVSPSSQPLATALSLITQMQTNFLVHFFMQSEKAYFLCVLSPFTTLFSKARECLLCLIFQKMKENAPIIFVSVDLTQLCRHTSRVNSAADKRTKMLRRGGMRHEHFQAFFSLDDVSSDVTACLQGITASMENKGSNLDCSIKCDYAAEWRW